VNRAGGFFSQVFGSVFVAFVPQAFGLMFVAAHLALDKADFPA
jgi:hypothetical protein